MGFVAAFCELGEFLGRPVRIYSSGMRLRLAYSLVIACEPEILITDEVLSVGDESFQRKCSHHILQHLNGGGTMVLATHNLYQAERLCDAAIWLDDGRVRAQGPCLEVTKAYKASLEEADSIHGTGMIQGIARARASVLQIEGAVGEEESVEVQFGAPLRITVDFAQPTRLEIRRPNGTLVVSVAIPGHGTFEISRPHLLPGRYTVRSLGFGQRVLDEVGVKCVGQRRELGMVYLEHRWV